MTNQITSIYEFFDELNDRAVLEVHLIKTLTDMYIDLNGIKSSSISPSTANVLGKGNRKNVC